MSKAAKTIFTYSIYLFCMGAGLLLAPNLLLPLFGFAETSEIWVRLLGLFTMTAGIYYFVCSRHEQAAFFRATIIGRLFFFAIIAVMVLVFHQPPMLLAIGSADLLGGIWTWISI